MGKLTIIGLGPGDPELLTRKAERLLRESSALILRTAEHGVADYLAQEGIAFTTMDACYEEAEDFDEIETLIARRVAAQVKTGDVSYAVPGQGLLSDGTVQKLLSLRIAVEIVPGLSVMDEALARGGKRMRDAADGVSQLPAALVTEEALNPRLPLLVTELDDPFQAGDAKVVLQKVYGDEAQGVLVTEKRVRVLPLEELDRQGNLDHLSAYFLPGRNEAARYDFTDLVELVSTLWQRSPWNAAQTHESLRKYWLQEAMEVLDAIDQDDPENLAEELGDMLYHVAFHACISQDFGDFDILDVTDGIVRKLRGRYPALFGLGEDKDWETLKAEQHGHKSVEEKIADIPAALPALMQGQKLMAYLDRPSQDAAAQALQEATQALLCRELPLGEWLLTVANYCNAIDTDAELSLRDACRVRVQKASEKI